MDKFVNAQQCTFIYSRVDNTTCKDLRHKACTHAQSRSHGNSGSQAASFHSSVVPIVYVWIGVNDMLGDHLLRVDRKLCIRYVWTGPKPLFFIFFIYFFFFCSVVVAVAVELSSMGPNTHWPLLFTSLSASLVST